jgi:hypothetical protein
VEYFFIIWSVNYLVKQIYVPGDPIFSFLYK